MGYSETPTKGITMFEVTVEIVNELDNKIQMSVKVTPEGVTIFATGPTSTVEHTWTHREADTIMNLLTIASDNAVALTMHSV